MKVSLVGWLILLVIATARIVNIPPTVEDTPTGLDTGISSDTAGRVLAFVSGGEELIKFSEHCGTTDLISWPTIDSACFAFSCSHGPGKVTGWACIEAIGEDVEGVDDEDK